MLSNQLQTVADLQPAITAILAQPLHKPNGPRPAAPLQNLQILTLPTEHLLKPKTVPPSLPLTPIHKRHKRAMATNLHKNTVIEDIDQI